MTIDKTLFKALVGGVGRRTALLLADTAGKHYVGQFDPAQDDVRDNELDIGSDVVLRAQAPLSALGVGINGGVFPLLAGAVVAFKDRSFSRSGTTHPDLFRARLTIVKVADGAGTPVTNVTAQFDASRSNGVVTLPSAVTGFTVAATSTATDGFQVTVAAAGHYFIKSYCLKRA